MSISRREFLETTALGALAAGSLAADGTNNGMPTRVLKIRLAVWRCFIRSAGYSPPKT